MKPYDLRDITLRDISQAQKDVHTFSLACRNSKVDLAEAEKRTVVIKGQEKGQKQREETIYDGPVR